MRFFSHSIGHILDACLVPLKHWWKLFFSQGSKMSWGGAQECVYTAGDCDSRDRGSLPVSHTSLSLGYTNRCKKSNQLLFFKISCHIAAVLLKLYRAVFEFACVCLWDSSVGGRSTWNSHMVGNYYQKVLLNNSQSRKVPTQYSSLVISVETGDHLLLQMADQPKFLWIIDITHLHKNSQMSTRLIGIFQDTRLGCFFFSFSASSLLVCFCSKHNGLFQISGPICQLNATWFAVNMISRFIEEVVFNRFNVLELGHNC